jgi:fumarate reductase subunit D
MAKTALNKEAENTLADSRPIFPKENYKFMLAGIVVIILGFLFMMGGDSNDPNSFKPEQVYSFRRITLAPIVIVLGLVIEVYAIMHRPKPKA